MTTRREILTYGLPAAFAGAGLASVATAAQQQGQQGRQGMPQGFQPGSKLFKVLSQTWDGNQYKLPPLPYEYNALEPHIDEQTMRLHHDKHHQGYVNGLNSAVEGLKQAAGQEAESTKLYGLQRNLSFNYGGHILHSLFWATMGPAGQGQGQGGGQMGGQPSGEVASALEETFGSFDAFKQLFKSSALTVKGSGWGILVYDTISDSVMVKAINEHDTHFGPGQIPLLPLDIWEHAFYLKYQNNKGEYIDAWFNVIDWQTVNDLFTIIRQAHRGGGMGGQSRQRGQGGQGGQGGQRP